MFKKRFIIIFALILFILSVDFVSASNMANDDLNENILSDNSLNTDKSSEKILNGASSDLNSNSENVEDSILQSENKEILKSTVKPSGNSFNDIQKL